MNLDKQVAEALGWESGGCLKEFWNTHKPEAAWGGWLRKDLYTPSTRINQAIELLEGLSWRLWNSPAEKTVYCRITDIENRPYGRFEIIEYCEHADTPAAAICKAFLNYKQSIKGENE